MTRHLPFVASLAACALLVIMVPLPGTQAAPQASGFAAARESVGAAAVVSGVKSLVLKGSSRNFNHGTARLVEGPKVEIRILLPDHYVRIETEDYVIKRYGFTGDMPLRDWKPRLPDLQMHFANSTPAAQLKAERTELARLMLGMLADVRTAAPYSVRTGGGGSAVAVAQPDGETEYLDLDPATHVPRQIRFQAQVFFPKAGGTETTVGNMRMSTMPEPVMAEVALLFEDRRVVSGLNLPFRIRRVARDITFSELRFGSIVVNAPLTQSDFDRPKDFRQ